MTEPARGAEGLRGARMLVLGLGITGVAVADAAARFGCRVLASDAGEVAAGSVAALEAAGVEVETGGHDRALSWATGEADLVVPSPGVPPHAAPLAAAVEHGVPVLSEVELAFRLTPVPVVAVTGTNGKTTVARMIGAALTSDGRRAVVCGNIGDAYLPAVLEHPDAELFVVEVSSFQLHFCDTFHPIVSVVTNLAPDHLDWHGSMEAYRAAKARIAENQGPQDTFLYPIDQPDLADLAPARGPRRIPFGLGAPSAGPGVWLDEDEIVVRLGSDAVVLGPATGPAARGRPFLIDALAAAGAAMAAGAAPVATAGALAGFQPDAHRVEPVCELDGVRFVDDSKATNPHAAVAAVRGFDHVVLILGGRNKGLDLGPIRDVAGHLRAVVAMGEAADEVVDAFVGTDVAVTKTGSMAEAVARAYSSAIAGDVVLLSPACSSYDRYRNYAQRGEAFRQACRDLMAGRTS